MKLSGIIYLRSAITIIVVMFLFTSVDAQLQPHRYFSDGMVLQREHVIPVWGKATAGDSVHVTLDGETVSTQADDSGNWRVELAAHDAGGPFSLIIATAAQQLTRNDVYIGDVWLASGQSNMEFQVTGTDSASQVIAVANDQMIRQFKIPKGLANEPSDELAVTSVWRPATSQYVGSFTAVGYFFAKELREHLGIPIGIINCSYGGSRIEAWMSDDMLGYDEGDIVLANGEPERQPTVAYNKMIHPLLGIPLKGFIWYQGESNADNMEDALAYGALFQNMITSWREIFGLGDIPFLWVQLPNYGQVFDAPQIWDAWPQVRKGQSSALVLPNTGEAVTIDVGGTDIHPTYKQPVGRRLARVARKVAYGEDIVYSGPRYKSNRLLENGSIEITFEYLGSGLVAEGSENGEVFGFAVADEYGNLSWADAVIDSDKVIVTSDTVAEPAIVRYAWEHNPATVNLYNAENLPAAPFLANVNPGFKIAEFRSSRSAVVQGESATLSWLVFGASSVTLDGIEVDSADTQIVTPADTTTYTLIAVNREDANEIDTATVIVKVLDASQLNRALNKTATASSYETSEGTDQLPSKAFDGNMTTRWSSAWQQGTETAPPDPMVDDNPDDEWLMVDLGEAIDISMVTIFWESAYGNIYDLEVSYDGYIWTTVHEERAGNGGEDNISLNPAVSGRYVRMHGLHRATQWGFSIFELEVYGMISENQPPAVTLSTAMSNVINSESVVPLTASATDVDGTIQDVKFYIDDELVFTDTEEPFQYSFSSSESGEKKATAIATDNNGISVQSKPYYVFVDMEGTVRFEAENASYTGSGNAVISSSSTSGGKYLEMRDAWTITFDGIGVDVDGDYLLTIAYQLTFDTPKHQFLYVNGDSTEYLMFTSPSTSLWLKRGWKIPLKTGENSLRIVGEWNWMSFDYISITDAHIVGIEEESEQLPHEFSLDQNYPNPFNPSTNITYSIPNTDFVNLEVYDITGQRIRTLVNEVKNQGKHEVTFDAKGLASGVYFYKLQFGNTIETKSMVLMR